MGVLTIQEEITGGESVYCINESQMRKTRDLVSSDSEGGRRIRDEVERLEKELSRNERAALAFTLIESLNGPPSG